MRTKQTPLVLIISLTAFLFSGFLSTCPANQLDTEESGDNDAPIITSSTGEIPRVLPSVKPLNLTRPPAREELMAAGQFGGQLFPTHEITDRRKGGEINLSFGHVMQAWNSHEYIKAVKLLKKHIDEYPDSPWMSEAVLHLGCDSQYNGRYTEAEQYFNWLIEENTGKTHEGATILLNKARLRLGVLKVYQFSFDEANELFKTLKKESSDWRDRTYASHWIQRLARETASEQAMLNCGTQALAYMLEKDCRETEAREVLGMVPEISFGHSIQSLSDIALQYGYKTAALKLNASELNDLPLPAIMHIQNKNQQAGHYWILENVAGNTVELYDPQSTRRYQQKIREFAKEWSGNTLVFSDKQKLPGKLLAITEIEHIYGGCCGVPRPEDNLGDPGRNAGPQSSGGCGSGPFGSPRWSVNMLNMNLFVHDIPLWYRNSIGPSVNISLSYNSEAAITNYEPFGNKWQFNYGSYLVVDSQQPEGTVTIFMPDGRRDVYTPDGNGGYYRQPSVYNILTKIAENHYELKFPDETIYVYNIPQGTNSQQPLLVTIRDPHEQTLSFNYDSNIRLTTITDELNRVTTLTYNTLGLVTQVTDPFNRNASFEYDANRNLVSITDMGGFTSSISYDEDVYVTSIENGRGSWEFDIEPADGIKGSPYPPPGGDMWANYRITITNPVGDKEEYFFEGSTGKESFYVSPKHYIPYSDLSCNGYNPNRTYFKINRDPYGPAQLTRITYPGGNSVSLGYDGGGNLSNITDVNGNSTVLTYNNYGRITSVRDPLDNLSQLAYDANTNKLTSFADAVGNSYSYEYDGSGNLSKMKYPDYPQNGDIQLKHNYYGAITCLTDTRGKAYQFEYGTTGNLTAVTNPMSNEDSYTYDSIGRAISHTDPNGTTLAYAYDNLNRITSVTYPGPSVKSFTYNCCRLGSVSYQNNTASFIYGTNGRVSSFTDVYGKTISYTYDKNGNLTTLTYPGNKVVTYEYDLADRLISVTDWLDNTVTYEYDLAGKLIKTGLPDGSTVINKYDNAARLTAIADYKSDGTINAVFNYTLNALGNRTGTSFTQPQNNVPSPSSIANTHADDNGLLTSGSATYEYDNNGNVITRTIGSEVTSYTWDYDNMLTQITSGCNTLAIYTYDVLGNRVAFGNTKYVVDPTGGLSKVLAETDVSGNITAYYVYGLGLISKITPTNQAYYYHFDGLGSTIAITNASGTVVNKYAYDEYGKVLSQTEGIANPFKYVGKYGVMDDGIGLLYMRARYYDYEMKRFINKDPIGFGGGDINLYSYVLNNPIRFIDPWGLWYMDKNYTYTSQYFLGITFGFMANDSGIYPYIGLSAGSPGFSTSLTFSDSDPCTGLNFGLQGTKWGLSGQYGYSLTGGKYREGGSGIGSSFGFASTGTGFIVFGPFK